MDRLSQSVLLLVAMTLLSSCVVGHTFLHVSDLHLDPLYQPSGNATDYCRSSNATSDLLATFTTTFGQYGCDAPQALVQSMLQSVNPSAIDFVIFTGDMSAHDLPDANSTMTAIGLCSNMLHDRFTDVPVVPTIGNNDCYPDYHLPSNGTWLRQLYDTWQYWIPSDQESNFLSGGFFGIDVTAELRVLSINTILFSMKHTPVIDADTVSDPAGQFAWMRQELSDAMDQGRAVYIMGHIPPGNDQYQSQEFWQNEYTDEYLATVSKYASVIKGQFFGHLHRDDFRVIWENPSHEDALLAATLAPSVSPSTDTNPSYRLVEYDTETYDLLDYTEIFADLALTYISGEMGWTEEYAFQDAYDEASLDPASFGSLYKKIQTDATVFSAYLSRRESQFSTDRYQYLCAIGSFDRRSFDVCMKTFNSLGALSQMKDILFS